MKNTLERVAQRYEHIALSACREAEEAGEDVPRMVSVFARQGGYSVDFLAPIPTLPEVREAIIKAGGEFNTIEV